MKNKDIIWLTLGLAAVAMFSGRTKRTPEENRLLFKPAFNDASENSGVPSELLERVAQQESAFRSDIIYGQTVSSAGAKGIMQIVPKWHPDVNPLDPIEAIHYAADYLSKLYNKYGNWTHALMAYNWGPGNVDKWLTGEIAYAAVPSETVNYYTDITEDTGYV